MITVPVEQSRSFHEAARFFLGSLRLWIEVSVEKYANRAAGDAFDQSSSMASWEIYLRLKPSRRVWDFFAITRDRIAAHMVETDLWKHGYWRISDVMPGTEHFLVFLNMLTRLNPASMQTREQILDAAEHIGGWVEGVPEWYDDRHGLFRSLRLGTEEIGCGAGEAMNRPAHLRLASLSLLAYRLTQNRRYLDVPVSCGQRWSEAINRSPVLPLALLPSGRDGFTPLYDLDGKSERPFCALAGEPCEDYAGPVSRAENFLAADAVNTFLRLWRYTGVEGFRTSAERILDDLAPSFADPDCGAAADAVRGYWRTTGSTRYHRAVKAAVSALAPEKIVELSLKEAGPRLKLRPAGVGKSREALAWLENGEPRRCSPVLLALAAELFEDAPLAARAVDLAHAYFKLARQVLMDGHQHGSAARTVSAVAGGHFRENQVGVVTGVLKPLIETFAAPEELVGSR